MESLAVLHNYKPLSTKKKGLGMSLVSCIGMRLKLWWLMLIEWSRGDMDDVYLPRTFILIEDYTSSGVWDEIVLNAHRFKTLPKGEAWRKMGTVSIPRGKWTLAHFMEPLMSKSAYDDLGIQKPTLSEMPVLLTLDRGFIVSRQNRVTLEQVLAAVNE